MISFLKSLFQKVIKNKTKSECLLTFKHPQSTLATEITKSGSSYYSGKWDFCFHCPSVRARYKICRYGKTQDCLFIGQTTSKQLYASIQEDVNTSVGNSDKTQRNAN